MSKNPRHDISSKLAADLLYARWDGLESLYEDPNRGITQRKILNFLKRMDLPDTYGQNLIDTERVSVEKGKVYIPVRKISEIKKQIKGETLGENQYYVVRIAGICENTATPEEKVNCIRNLHVHCACPSKKVDILPEVKFPIDKHIFMALNYSSIHLGTYDMGVFGYPSRTVQEEKELMKRIIDLGIKGY